MLSPAARRWVILLAALALMALTARLGRWQMDRAAQKRDLQATIVQRAELPPLPASSLAHSEDEAAGQWYRHAWLEGQWIPGTGLWLDNRPLQGRPGFIVLAALRLADGSAVLVQRGWVPRLQDDRRSLPQVVPVPEGRARLWGRLAPWPSKYVSLGSEGPGPMRKNVDAAALATAWGLHWRPFSLQLESVPGASEDRSGVGVQDWPAPALDVSKHDGYAVQWFLLCALTGGLYVWFQVVRPWRERGSKRASA
jgi:surfeit locus 1 family protein